MGGFFIANPDLRAPCPLLGGGRGRHSQVLGEGVALGLVIEILEAGVRTVGDDVVHHVVGAGDAAEFDNEPLLAAVVAVLLAAVAGAVVAVLLAAVAGAIVAVLLAAVAGVLPVVEGRCLVQGGFGHNFMLENFLLEIHGAFIERFLL